MIRSARLGTMAVLLMAGVGIAQPRPRRLPPRRYPPPRPTAVVSPPVVPDPVPAPPATTVIVAVPPPATLTPPALVQPLPDRDAGNYVSLGFLGGYGTSASTVGEEFNDFRESVGAWLAYTFRPRVSLGIEALYHFGGSHGAYLSSPHVHNIWIGGQVGYDAIVGPVMFRPYALVGGMMESVECTGCTPPRDDTRTRAALGVGIGIHLLLSALFVGVDGRSVGIFDVGVTWQTFGTIGIRIR